ncbi:hypothetical protein Syun_004148 [Stephania yunnanensis]|uniref:Retrotransposon Copia-like N-terminal domain-containing protein n=1 Tax=Stephania yunnanensis TaxID=152371 RepID=A0AAP0L2S1_9MAGN
MEGHLFGTKPCPAPMLDFSGTPNPKYEDWIIKDNYLICWLLNSLEAPIATQFVGAGSCYLTWKAIENLCGAHNREKVQICRASLQATRKSTLSMTDYLFSMNQFADNLSAAGSPIPLTT